jgi:hypothetical protein
MSLPSSYRSRRGHIHLPRVLPLVGCRSKTPTEGTAQLQELLQVGARVFIGLATKWASLHHHNEASLDL